MSKFPNVIAAAERIQEHESVVEGKDLWALGDALVKECGEPRATAGKNDGSYNQIKIAAEALGNRGLTYKGSPYKVSTLKDLRYTAFNFPKSTRRENVNFWVHYDAGNPEMLGAIARMCKAAGKPLTFTTVREYSRELRRRAFEEARKNEPGAKLPAKRNVKPPGDKDLPLIVDELELMSAAHKARKLGEDANKAIADKAHLISDNNAAVLTDVALTTANIWREVAETVRKAKREKRDHLRVINE